MNGNIDSKNKNEVNETTAKSKNQNSIENSLLMPLIQSGVSMQPDMKLGWKPKIEISGAPIPLYYEFEHI